jgi:phage terminase large subunit GpA-like protein
MFQSLEQIILAAAEGVRPPERFNIAQAAEKYVYLNNPGSYVGYYTHERTPYTREVEETLTSLDYTGVVMVGPARTGKTQIALNAIAHSVVCDPADSMVIGMTQASIRDWSQKELRRMFRNSSEVGARVRPGRQNMNVHDVHFTNGMSLLLKWPTISELSGKTIQRLYLQDYDRMPQDVDGEGNPFDLARTRSQTFGRFGMTFAESSPGFPVSDAKWIARTQHEAPPTQDPLTDAGGILGLYNRGDRRRWYWRCPQCEEPFQPRFDRLSWPETKDKMEAAEAASLVCSHCGFPIPSSMKHELNIAGRWVKDGMIWMPDGSMRGTPIRSDIASFWMFGPAAGFSDWKTLVFRYLTAMEEFEQTGSEEGLKVTTTVDQGEPYLSAALSSNRMPEELKARAEDWGGSADDPVVPEGVRFLTATIDVQAGGRPSFVVHVFGHGEGNDIWHVDMFKIRHAVDRYVDDVLDLVDPAAYPEDWHQIVEKVIEKTYPLGDGSGRRMAIKIVGCDSGGREGVTTNAYNFWRWLRDEYKDQLYHRTFRLLKGDSPKNGPRMRETYPDAQRRDRKSGSRGDVPVLMVHSNLLKDQVSAMLGRTEPGGGMVHFPIWAENWLYTQLTTEIRTAKGWENPTGKRNEAFDLLYYACGLVLHSTIRAEHIDWSKPPPWADVWDKNELVTSTDGKSARRKTASLADLAQQLG